MQKNDLGTLAATLAICCLSFALDAQSLTSPPATSPVVPMFPLPPETPATPAPHAASPAPAPLPTINPADLPGNIIAWDATDKGTNVPSGEPAARYIFALANVSAAPVTILSVHTSCGCTTAQLPPMPWKLDPGSNGLINVNMNLAGRSGTVIKTVSVATDKGTKHLLVRTTIEPMSTSSSLPPGTREQNLMMAMADRQTVFRSNCASCHGEPAKGRLGKELYAAVCGICHEADHRANMVPDLKVARQPRNADYWRNWITNGRQGSLMPAFAIAAGGILTDEQINSLVEHLNKTMPATPTPTAR